MGRCLNSQYTVRKMRQRKSTQNTYVCVWDTIFENENSRVFTVSRGNETALSFFYNLNSSYADIFFTIYQPDTHAIKRASDFLFSKHSCITKICLTILGDDCYAKQLFEMSGFQEEVLYSKQLVYDDQLKDLRLMSLFRN